jgi:hypothetical protein
MPQIGYPELSNKKKHCQASHLHFSTDRFNKYSYDLYYFQNFVFTNSVQNVLRIWDAQCSNVGPVTGYPARDMSRFSSLSPGNAWITP